MSKTAEATAETGAPKKSKKKLLIIIVLAVVLLGGGGGAYLMLGSKGPTTPPKPTPGAVVPLDAITVNLAGGHYLKIHLALQATADAGEKVDGSQALDLTVAQFSNRTRPDLPPPKARPRAKEKPLPRGERAHGDRVRDIYCTKSGIR